MPMNFFNGIPDPIVTWVLTPLLIIIARILDVSLGTIRIILIGKGYRSVAAFLGFFEVLIWITAIGQIMQNLNNFFYYLSFATGFSLGTYIGIVIENKLSLGQVIVRVITSYNADKLLLHFREQDYTVTSVNAQGNFGNVKIIFLIIQRQNLKKVVEIIKEFNPKAFYSIEDVRFVTGSSMSPNVNPIGMQLIRLKETFNKRK